MSQNPRTIITQQIKSVIPKSTMTKDKETKRELILHKHLIKDLMRQINTTMHSHLQMCELIELIIKIIMKQSTCKGCSPNRANDSGSDDDDDNKKYTFHTLKNTEVKVKKRSCTHRIKQLGYMTN